VKTFFKQLQKIFPLIELEKTPGVNPTITRYNASDIKIYNATNSIASF
jgi:hypothetical protein